MMIDKIEEVGDLKLASKEFFRQYSEKMNGQAILSNKLLICDDREFKSHQGWPTGTSLKNHFGI
jgi:hypothetical protein